MELLSHAFWRQYSTTTNYEKPIQSTLGLETLDKAAALGLETATPLTGPRQGGCGF